VSASLFREADPPPKYQTVPKGPIPSLENCPKNVLSDAKRECANAGALKEGCIFDICAARMPEAGQADLAAAAVAEEVGGLPSLMSRLPAVGPVTGFFGVVLLALFVAGVALGGRPRRRHMAPTLIPSFDDDTVERDASRVVRRGGVTIGEDGEQHAFLRVGGVVRSVFSGLGSSARRGSSARGGDAVGEDEALLMPVASEYDAL